MLRGALTITILGAVSAPARADPCADARAELEQKDLVRASIDASVCGDEALVADVEDRASDAGYSAVDISTDPDGATVVVEPAPDRPFTAPRRVWLPPGRHTVTALADGQPMVETLAVVKDGNSARVFLSLPPPPDAAADGTVDMGEEGGGEMSSGPPPKVELPSLLPERYQRGVDAPHRVSWSTGPLIMRREYRWQIEVGPAAVIAGGDVAWGARIEVERKLRRDMWEDFWYLAPALSATVVRTPDATVGALHASALVGPGAWMSVSKPIWGIFGAGPDLAVVRGQDDRDGVSAGIAAGAELARRAWVISIRGDLPLLSTAEVHGPEVDVLLGRRW